MRRHPLRRTLALIGAILSVGVVAAALGIFIGFPGPKSPELAEPNITSPTSPASSPTPSESRPPDDAKAVSQALQDLAKDPSVLMASDTKNAVTGNARDAIPSGTSVSTDEESWAPDGLGGGTMIVTITPPNKPSQQYAAVMVKEDGGWKILSTFVLGATS